jgi:3-isopropylmalate/(R)-2-methylmalate dehydratase small subunit
MSDQPSRLRSSQSPPSSGEARQSAEGAAAAALSPSSAAISHVEGRALPLRGHDVDTDRIMPARFLVAVSFEGLERHLFEDDRKADASHAFNDPRYNGAAILVVNTNFGCGSSREHAPQGLVRAGYRAIIGESFSEIFQGNSAMLGMPCFVASHEDVERLQTLIEKSPETAITVEVASGAVTAGGLHMTATLPAALRDGFLSGQWNPTAMLLDQFDEVRAVAARLPYVNGF